MATQSQSTEPRETPLAVPMNSKQRENDQRRLSAYYSAQFPWEAGDLNLITIFEGGPKQPALSWVSGTRNDNEVVRTTVSTEGLSSQAMEGASQMPHGFIEKFTKAMRNRAR